MHSEPHVRRFTSARIVALAVIGIMALGLLWLGLKGEQAVVVPTDARAGSLTLKPCTYTTEAGAARADCGTLTVPENRRNPGSSLIALPVIRIRATGTKPEEPIFKLQGGPGQTNMEFPQASRLTDRHDVVLVGYRGADGSTILNCPEVDAALRTSADLAGASSFGRATKAFTACARRLTKDGVDLAGYSLSQRVDDFEAARVALGYQRINLISSSAGTRTAMIYSWRYPKSIHRSAMIGVNPPGHFIWDPTITDRQLAHYAELCRQDTGCSTRTDDLAASMRRTATAIPQRWGPLRIKNGNVRAASMFGLFQTSRKAAPLNAPTILDAWLTAADGDPSGFWAMSTLGDLAFPGTFVWGEFAASGMIDATAIDRYYAAGGDPGSILGNAAADLLVSGGGLTKVWPANADDQQYQDVRSSDVETLLISGTVDFTTPAELAADELLPKLPNGHQVKLTEMGHTGDFWDYQAQAGRQLLSSFYDRGVVDDSQYTPQKVDFEVGKPTMATIAKVMIGILVGGAVIALAVLGLMIRRVRRRGSVGPRTSVWLRTLTPLILGLGGWFLAVLIVWSAWPAMFIGSRLLAVPSMGIPIGLGIYWAWVHRDWSSTIRHQGLAVALVGALLGAWLGFGAGAGLASVLTTIVGATLAANLALLVLDLDLDRRTPRRAF